MAFAHANIAALKAAIAALPPGPSITAITAIGDQPARRAQYVLLYTHQSDIIQMCYQTDPAEGAELIDMIARYQSLLVFTQQQLGPAPAVVPAPAPPVPAPVTGMRPKQAAITKCNLQGPSVQLFLTSMVTACTNLTFTDDKQKAHYYVNNLTDSSKETLFAIHDPVRDDVWYTSINVITFIEKFISKNKGTQALKAIRSVKMLGNGLFTYFNLMNKLYADANSTAETTIPESLQVRYFIDGLNPDSIPTNLKLTMTSYLAEHPTSTVTDLYQQAEHIMDTVLGPNHSTAASNGRTGNDFHIPKRRSGGQPQRPPEEWKKQRRDPNPRNDSNRRPPRQTQQPGKQQGGAACARCGHSHHNISQCTANFHKDKYPLPPLGQSKGKAANLSTPPGYPALPPPPWKKPEKWKKKPPAAKTLTLPLPKGNETQLPQPKGRRIQSIVVVPSTSGKLTPITSDEDDELHSEGSILPYPKVSANSSAWKVPLSSVSAPRPRERSTSGPRVVTFAEEPSSTPTVATLTIELPQSPPPLPLNEDPLAPRASLQEKLTAHSKKMSTQFRQFLASVDTTVEKILDRPLIVKK